MSFDEDVKWLRTQAQQARTIAADVSNVAVHHMYATNARHFEHIAARLASQPEELTFDALRQANVARLPLFKNRHGEPAHSQPDGSDWCLAQWCNAVTGELGEAANLIKKIERGDLTLDEARAALADELADVQTYLDILAFRAGVDLGEATVQKWNEVSERVGVDLRLSLTTAHRRLTREEANQLLRDFEAVLKELGEGYDSSRYMRYHKLWFRIINVLTGEDERENT